MDKNSKNDQVKDDKQIGCWAKFKSLFEGRGFDLEFEYNNHRTAVAVGDNNDGYKKIDDRKSVEKRTVSESSENSLEGELAGVINFYEQFSSLGDDTKDDVDVWRRSSGVRNRVSIRPSALLTNIIEENGECEDDVELVSAKEKIKSEYAHFGRPHYYLRS